MIYQYNADRYQEFLKALPKDTKHLFNIFMSKYDQSELWSRSELEAWSQVFKPHGISFDYGLDLEPYDIIFRDSDNLPGKKSQGDNRARVINRD